MVFVAESSWGVENMIGPIKGKQWFDRGSGSGRHIAVVRSFFYSIEISLEITLTMLMDDDHFTLINCASLSDANIWKGIILYP